MTVSFETADVGDGLVVVDPIERHRFVLETPTAVTPQLADPARLYFPVDGARRIVTDRIGLPTVVATFVRDENGTMLAELGHNDSESFPQGTYTIDLCGPIKLYLSVESALTVRADDQRTAIEFSAETPVVVGARSKHGRPEATITTTDAVADVMTAVSHLGSALKTTSPERSFPNMRGHPPLIERGDRLNVPEAIDPPETGIELRIPPDRGAVYAAAPLAYYLGATVVPGDRPRIVTDDGFEYALDGQGGYEEALARTLKQTFLLDCVTRTEGLFEIDLHARDQLEPKVDLDFGRLYDRPPAARLRRYLSVPYDIVEPHLPQWKLACHVEPTPDNVAFLPFLIDDLAVIRTPTQATIGGSKQQTALVDEFYRESEAAFVRSSSTPAPGVRSTGASADAEPSFVHPRRTDSLEHAWVGEGMPIEASKPTLAAYRNRLDRSPAAGDIGVTVVVNDPRMQSEGNAVDETYASQEALPFDVTTYRSLTTERLRFVLETETEFLHYIGHIDENGFECVDGSLDAHELETTGVDAFLLNACTSYEQGMALLEAGAIGGAVTLSRVGNEWAADIGSAMAGLLNCGFPLRSALEIVRETKPLGDRYIVVGDGNLAIAQAESVSPNLLRIRSRNNEFELDLRIYPTFSLGIGAGYNPALEETSKYFLNSGWTTTFTLSEATVQNFLSLENIPVQIDDELKWSQHLEIQDI